jgi:hypothetical protein
LREVTDTSLYYPVYEFTNDRIRSENLRARLRITEDVVTDFALGRLERVVVMEELHTALEQSMRELLPDASQWTKWPKLVELAGKAGHLDLDRLAYAAGDQHTPENLLLDEGINKRRNAAKHRDGDPDDSWITDHWQCLAMLLEHLVDNLAKQGSVAQRPD